MQIVWFICNLVVLPNGSDTALDIIADGETRERRIGEIYEKILIDYFLINEQLAHTFVAMADYSFRCFLGINCSVGDLLREVSNFVYCRVKFTSMFARRFQDRSASDAGV